METKTTSSTMRGSACCSRFWWELHPKYPLFSIEEPVPIYDDDDDDVEKPASENPIVVIDLVRAFAPRRPCYLTVIIRAALLYWSVQVLAVDVRSYPPHNLYIYMGYLTHWGHTMSIIYLFCSFLCALCPNWLTTETNHPNTTISQPSRLVKITWGLYSTVAPLEIAITLLYWSAVSNEPPDYITVMEHGGIALLVLLDGIFIGLVPIRVKHIFFLITVCILYLSWSVIDAVYGIGNGEWGPAYDDDALYPVLNWNSDRKGAALVSAFAICILAPAIFVLCWTFSLMSFSPMKQENAQSSSCNAGGCCGTCDGSRRPLITSDVINDERADGNKNSDNAFEYENLGDIETT